MCLHIVPQTMGYVVAIPNTYFFMATKEFGLSEKGLYAYVQENYRYSFTIKDGIGLETKTMGYRQPVKLYTSLKVKYIGMPTESGIHQHLTTYIERLGFHADLIWYTGRDGKIRLPSFYHYDERYDAWITLPIAFEREQIITAANRDINLSSFTLLEPKYYEGILEEASLNWYQGAYNKIKEIYENKQEEVSQ